MNKNFIKIISFVLLCLLSLSNITVSASLNGENLEEEFYDEITTNSVYEEGNIVVEARSALLM